MRGDEDEKEEQELREIGTTVNRWPVAEGP
jgi:hypothetical protein